MGGVDLCAGYQLCHYMAFSANDHWCRYFDHASCRSGLLMGAAGSTTGSGVEEPGMTRGFFGYGSLVNTRTHDFKATPARLHGWRRTWCATPARGAAFLSVEPASDGLLLGVTAPVPGNSWAALDEREASYDRVDVSDQFGSMTVVYSVPQSSKCPPKSIVFG